MHDQQFDSINYKLSEVEHKYGPNCHLFADPFLLSHLAQLCFEETKQPLINELLTTIYLSLLRIVVNNEFPIKMTNIKTRMAKEHPDSLLRYPMINPATPIVSVSLARAGTLPSHICFNALNYFMLPEKVRQDHISIGRMTDDQHKVTGSRIASHKVGGDINDAIVLFPDPMGATGGTIIEAIEFYKSHGGKALKYIALHCIVTPEYLNRVQSLHPDLIVYAVRLDRGLSSSEVLSTIPGTFRDRERGLNDKHYIVPGGGGFGEIINNAYV